MGSSHPARLSGLDSSFLGAMLVHPGQNWGPHGSGQQGGPSQRLDLGTSLVVQWLRLWVSTEQGGGSIPVQGSKVSNASRCSQKQVSKPQQLAGGGKEAAQSRECRKVTKGEGLTHLPLELVFVRAFTCFLLKDGGGFPGGSEVKNQPASAGDRGLTPGSGRSAGEGNGSPLQYACLENSMDRGAWWATVHVVTKSQSNRSTATEDGEQAGSLGSRLGLSAWRSKKGDVASWTPLL